MNPESDFARKDAAVQAQGHAQSIQQVCAWLDAAEASNWLEGLESRAHPVAAEPAERPALPRPLFGWQDEYSVQIGVFDEHHRNIFQLLNRLHEAILLHEGRAAVGVLLDELIDHTRWHFAAEELLMQAFAFPEALAHELDHERQLRVLLEFREQFADQGEQFVTLMLEYMGSWLIRHILTTDRHYSAFFAERGACP